MAHFSPTHHLFPRGSVGSEREQQCWNSSSEEQGRALHSQIPLLSVRQAVTDRQHGQHLKRWCGNLGAREQREVVRPQHLNPDLEVAQDELTWLPMEVKLFYLNSADSSHGSSYVAGYMLNYSGVKGHPGPLSSSTWPVSGQNWLCPGQKQSFHWMNPGWMWPRGCDNE